MRIGLFGGSFNPPHEGHLLVSRIALTRLGLDRIWWLVTPGNPLKDTRDLPPLATRIEAARRLAGDRRIVVTGIEAEIGARYTADTLNYLRARCRNVRFVWIMGGDNLRDFHRWRDWKHIANLAAIAVIARPGASPKAGLSRFARQFARYRLPQSAARTLGRRKLPAWVYISAPLDPVSSTELRAQMALNALPPI